MMFLTDHSQQMQDGGRGRGATQIMAHRRGPFVSLHTQENGRTGDAQDQEGEEEVFQDDLIAPETQMVCLEQQRALWK